MEKRNNLICLRERQGMTQKDVAAALNVSRQAVSQWERDLSMPSTEKLLALSQLFGVTVEELYQEEGEGDVELEPKGVPESTEVPAADLESETTPNQRCPYKKVLLAALLAGCYLSIYIWGVLTDSATMAKICLVFVTLLIVVGCFLFWLITMILERNRKHE